MTTLVAVPRSDADRVGRPQSNELVGEWWHLVSVGCRPTDLVCPRCWPSYYSHAAQMRGSRRHAMQIVRLTPVDPSIYICHQCHRNGSETCH